MASFFWGGSGTLRAGHRVSWWVQRDSRKLIQDSEVEVVLAAAAAFFWRGLSKHSRTLSISFRLVWWFREEAKRKPVAPFWGSPLASREFRG